MDRAIVERAVKALAALNAGSGSETRSTSARSARDETEKSKGKEIESCGSSHCAGCYEVQPGVRVHPPKCGENYRAWLERWESKDKVQ